MADQSVARIFMLFSKNSKIEHGVVWVAFRVKTVGSLLKPDVQNACGHCRYENICKHHFTADYINLKVHLVKCK